MRRVLLSLCFLAGLTTSAQADAVPMPPAACPYGSTPSTCHGGAYCAVKNCEVTSDCPTGRTCKEAQACFYQLDCQGMIIKIDALRPTYNSMKSACPSSGLCAGTNQACETQKICVTPDGTSTVTAPLTSTTTSVATRSNTDSSTGTKSSTQTGTSISTASTNSSTGVRTDPVTSVASASRTQSATATQTETRTIPITNLSTGTGTGTGTGAATSSATTSKISTETSVAPTGNQTSQLTSLATSASTSTGTTQDAGTANVKLGDSGCSCRIGDWASAKALGPWLLAGVFSAVVTLLRRRRGSRK